MQEKCGCGRGIVTCLGGEGEGLLFHHTSHSSYMAMQFEGLRIRREILENVGLVGAETEVEAGLADGEQREFLEETRLYLRTLVFPRLNEALATMAVERPREPIVSEEREQKGNGAGLARTSTPRRLIRGRRRRCEREVRPRGRRCDCSRC